jgi:hypothetical protein
MQYKSSLRVLIACEESQEVCKAFRALGHEAYSCDIQECSGGHPEWHLQMDVFEAFRSHGPFDQVIAFPPCTYISKVSNAFFNVQKYGEKAIERKRLSEEAKQFFIRIWELPVERLAIENPIGFMSSWKKPTQIIHPWYFGDGQQKATCLWLRGLPRLNGNPEFDKPEPIRVREGKRNRNVTWSESLLSTIADHKERAKIRSKTFPGIARAMALQWGGKVETETILNSPPYEILPR